MEDPVITVERYEQAREEADDIWTDYDVFSEERDGAPLREIVLEVVEGQYTHPAGPEPIYGMEESATSLVWDKIFSSGLVPDGVPRDVREKFAQKLDNAVREHAKKLYLDIKDEIDPESDDLNLGEVQEVLESTASEIVPEIY